MKQSFCIPCFRTADQPLAELFRHAREIGYGATELWMPDSPDHLREIVATAHAEGLKVASFTGHDSIDRGLNDPDQWDRIESELVASINLANELGIPGVICFSGNRRPGVSDALGLAYFLQGVRRILPHAEAKGINLNLEVLNSRRDHPGYMADTVDWAIAACVGANSPRLKRLYDVYHVQIMEGNVIESLRRAAPYLGHIHTAGVPGRHELDDAQELSYRAIATALRELGYEGYVGHELFPRGDRKEALRQAFLALE